MLEREQILLRTLLQELGDVFQRTGLPGICTLPLPEAFQDNDTFSPSLSPAPTERVERLRPIFTTLTGAVSQQTPPGYSVFANRYPLKPLSFTSEHVMPQSEEAMSGYLREDYRQIWQGFFEEMQALQQRAKHFHSYFFTLYFLIKKYFSRVPSQQNADISLFDAARVATAVADCRYQYHAVKRGKQTLQSPPPTHEMLSSEEEHEVLLIEGRVSGIQKFFDTLATSQQNHLHLTKRVRGRSFYLHLLTETLAEYLMTQLDLTMAHQVWCIGGHFLLIAPHIPAVTYHVKSCLHDIQEFIFRKFQGDLTVILDYLPLSMKALHEQIGSMRQELHMRLERENTRPLSSILQEQACWQFPPGDSDKRDTSDSFVEQQHVEYEQLGARLPRLNQGDGRLVKKTKAATDVWKEPPLVEFPIGNKLHIGWDINPSEYAQTDTIYLVNNLDEKFWGGSSTKYGFKLLATHVDTYTSPEADRANIARPVGRQNLPTAHVHSDDLKHVADMVGHETGEYLGVLWMDIDYLDAVFGAGLPRSKCSLSRIAALSTDLEFFIHGYINTICHTEFRKNTAIMHAGDDDVCIVGAWDTLVDLACRIYQDFRHFTCHMLNISGGLFLCKTHYPINCAMEHARYLLERLGKENLTGACHLNGTTTTRGAFTIFHQRLDWDDFLILRETGERLIDAIIQGNVSRQSVRTLLKLHRTWERDRHLNTARLFYIVARTIQNRTCRNLMLSQQKHLENSSYLPALISYVMLKTRHTP